ncbi:hypothetical protein KKB40_04400 [Patescibacteria group bacterium]|nr:hypothetical protein [Patescibacteria group bacterium]
MTLTKNDLRQIENLLDGKIVNMEEKFGTILTGFRSDFYEKIDPILKEVLTARDERPIIVHRQSDHEDRIENLEKIHPQGKHPFTVA